MALTLTHISLLVEDVQKALISLYKALDNL